MEKHLLSPRKIPQVTSMHSTTSEQNKCELPAHTWPHPQHRVWGWRAAGCSHCCHGGFSSPTCTKLSQICPAVSGGRMNDRGYLLKGTKSLITQIGYVKLEGCVLPTKTLLEKPTVTSKLKKHNAKEQHLTGSHTQPK